MENDRLQNILDGKFDDSIDCSLRSMIGDFYTRKMTTFVIIVWAYGAGAMILAILCAVRFFDVDTVKDQIMYAVGFSCLLGQVGLMKILAWQMIQRVNVKREVKRLELAIAKLSEQLKIKE